MLTQLFMHIFDIFTVNTVQNDDIYGPLPLLHGELLLGLTLLLGHSDVHHLTLEHKILEKVVFYFKTKIGYFSCEKCCLLHRYNSYFQLYYTSRK
jgi:hypothetical protein